MSKQRYAFYFDSNACTGCKACQIACKDKHDLEVGRTWRKVYEVTGGDWVEDADAWRPNVFTYYLSISCNHCEKPICEEICPTASIQQREDGIVIIDEDKCIGCRYCEWACPYGAPQYDANAGRMTKCDMCADYVDEGRLPACVASCPSRALDFGTVEELEAKYGAVDGITHRGEIYPLPDTQLTEPSLMVRPHRHSVQIEHQPAKISNKEEV